MNALRRLSFLELLLTSLIRKIFHYPNSIFFVRLDLPPYPSEEIMCDKLTQAVEETCGFAVV